MKLSIADYTWPRLNHDIVLQVIASMRVDAVDVALFSGASHLDLHEVVGDPDTAARDLRTRLDRLGLGLADVFLTPGRDLLELSPTHPDRRVQEQSETIFRRVVAFSAAAGSPGVTLLPGVCHGAEPWESALTRAAAALRRRVEIAGSSGLECSVEPHVDSVIDTPDRTAALLEQVPGLSLTLDLGHYFYQGYTLTDIQDLVSSVRHVQVRPAQVGVMQCRVKEDESDIRSLVSWLQQAGYDGYLASEFVWMEKWNCDRVDNTNETAELIDLLRSACQEN